MVNPLLAIAVALIPNFQIVTKSESLRLAVGPDEQRLREVGFQYGIVRDAFYADRQMHECGSTDCAATSAYVVGIEFLRSTEPACSGLERNGDRAAGAGTGSVTLLDREGGLPGHESCEQKEQLHG